MPKKKKKEEEIKEEPTEITDRDIKDEKEIKEKDKKKKKEKWEEISRLKVEVDFWKTDLHGKEIGIRQKDQQRAKSRQFSKDMDIYGSVKVGGEDKGHVGFRKDEWEDNHPEQGELSRLVVRYFTETDRWVASIEQNNIKGLMLSLGYERGTPVFDLFHQGFTKIFHLEKIERGSGSMDRVMVPLILKKEGKEIDYFIIAEKRFTIGSDWKVFRAQEKDKTLAEFDSKKFNIGGKVVIDIYDPELAKNKVFINTMVLFGALIKFWDEVVDRLADYRKKYMKNELPYKPDRHELQLLENPRGRRN